MRGWLVPALAAASFAAAAQDGLVPYRVEGDSIRAPLAAPGDAARGKGLAASRDSNCLLCHVVPDSGGQAMGDIGPSLAGVGSRFEEGRLRLRVVDSMRLNPVTVMPSYYRLDGLRQVGEAWRGKPVLTAQQVEDVVAYLLTLR
jgi:L-cysteine S-thiosulfotransferase